MADERTRALGLRSIGRSTWSLEIKLWTPSVHSSGCGDQSVFTLRASAWECGSGLGFEGRGVSLDTAARQIPKREARRRCCGPPHTGW